MPKRLDPRSIINALTLLVVAAWMGVFIARLNGAQIPVAPTLDAGLLIILGYWFSKSARNGEKNETRP